MEFHKCLPMGDMWGLHLSEQSDFDHLRHSEPYRTHSRRNHELIHLALLHGCSFARCPEKVVLILTLIVGKVKKAGHQIRCSDKV